MMRFSKEEKLRTRLLLKNGRPSLRTSRCLARDFRDIDPLPAVDVTSLNSEIHY